MSDSIVKSLRDGILTIYDGSGGITNHYTLVLDEGNLSWDQHQNVNVVSDRGTLDHVRKGDEQPIDISFGFKLTRLTGGASATLAFEALTQTGKGSTWTSTRGEDVYCVTLKWALMDTSDAVNETVEFSDFWYETLNVAEGDEYDVVTCTGKALVTAPTIT